MTIAEVAQTDYVVDQIRLDDEARDMAAKGASLTSRVFRNYARIAYRAAKAEADDPEPEVAPCKVCRGVQACDWLAHGVRGETPPWSVGP